MPADWTDDQMALALQECLRVLDKEISRGVAAENLYHTLTRFTAIDRITSPARTFQAALGKIGDIRTNVGTEKPGRYPPDQKVWKQYLANPSRFRGAASALKDAIESGDPIPLERIPLLDEEVAPEGEFLTRMHLLRERSS